MSLSPQALPGALGTLLLFGLAAPAMAQQDACAQRATHPSTTTYAPLTASLPVDRVSDLLLLGPGVVGLDGGELNVRNAGVEGNALYVDGVPVNPGVRGGFSPALGGSYYGFTGPGIGIGTNGFRQLRLTSGLTPLDLGNVRGGAIEVETEPCNGSDAAVPAVLRAGIASDAMFGTSNGLGFNRFTVEGLRRFSRIEVGGAAVVEGQKSARLGREQNGSPIYVRDGIDTSVTFDAGSGNNVTVDVDRFRASDGIRIPNSAASSYTLSGQLTWFLGANQRVRLSGLASQRQDRIFSYRDLYNPNQTFGDRNWSQVVTASWFGRLSESSRMRISAEAHASLQWDHATTAPLSGAGERDSRDPGLGLLLSPLDFRFAQSNFPIDDQLIRSFRTNGAGQSPYDLNNPTQYLLVDAYRNSAYGLYGFSESGGPVGTMTLYDEKRLVGRGAVTAEFGPRSRLRVGIEGTSYDAGFYTSQMVSQAGSGAFLEKPKAIGAFGEYQLDVEGLTATAGLRYDRFSSGASRAEFPRISSMPGYDPADPTALFVADKAHSAVSPRLSAVYQASPRLRVFGGYTGLAQIPDFSVLFAGINTDLSTTSPNTFFGTDLDFQRTGLFEGGAEVLLGPSTTFSGTLWSRSDKDLVAVQLRSEFDPFRGTNTDVFRARNALDATTTGFDARLTRSIGEHGQTWLSYSFAAPDDDVKAGTRKHNVAAAVLYETGAESSLLGGLLKNTGVYGTFRYASGTTYTACPLDEPNDVGKLSGDLCTFAFDGDINGATLPSLKVLDLRVSRGFNLGMTQLVAFVDARNLLNLETVTRVFAQTGTTSNDRERDAIRAGNLAEYGNEATMNGVYSNNTIDLSFGGAADPRAACGNWMSSSGQIAAPNCVYLINAEQHFGNGDHLFTEAEQRRASDAFYYVARGEQNFTAPGRRVRLGLEVRF